MGGKTNGTVMTPADPKHFEKMKMRPDFHKEYNQVMMKPDKLCSRQDNAVKHTLAVEFNDYNNIQKSYDLAYGPQPMKRGFFGRPLKN